MSKKCEQCNRSLGVKKINLEGKGGVEREYIYLCAFCRDDDRYAEVRTAKITGHRPQ